MLRGSLKRHVQSLAGIAQGYANDLATSLQWPSLNEYDSHAVVRAVRSEPLPKPDTPEAYREHFRALRDGLQAWMAGRTQPEGMPPYTAFVAGVNGALDHVRQQHQGHVSMVSSGGPISTAGGQVLGTSAATTIELNLRIRNSALTEFAFTPKRHMLVSYNHLPHLDHADRRVRETYS